MTDSLTKLTASLADRYRLDRELGQGGMATVYLAHDLKHDRDVAIKVLHPDLGAALGAERFLSEIRTTARLQHPHILPLLDSGDADGLLYYVMPLVTGETLRARLDREQQLPIANAVLISREVADALQYAHGLGVIHRDIKPENILLQNGHAIVADFGIALAVQSAGGARMTQTGLSLGTPQYMSPEQAMGERTIDARSDIYALGAMLYEMLTGEPPFTGATLQAVVAKVVSAEPARPSLTRRAVTDALEQAVLRALEKLPADRFASAADFSAALGQPAAASGPTARAIVASRHSSRGMWLTLSALTLVAGAIGGWYARDRTSPTTPHAPAHPMRLTHAGEAGCVALAPGGQQFALIAGRFTDETQCSGRLVVRPVPAGPDLEIAHVENVVSLRWSPTGDALVIAGQPAGRPQGVWLFPTKGGGARQLVTGVVLSAGFVDAAHVIAMTRADSTATGRDALPTVRIIDANSGEVTDSLHLPQPAGSDVNLSASGRWIEFASASGTQHIIASRAGTAVDSVPSGSLTAFAWIGDSAIMYETARDFPIRDLVMQRVDRNTGHVVGAPVVLVAILSEIRSLSVDFASRTVMWTTPAVTDELHLMTLPSPAGSRRLTRTLSAYLGNPLFSPDGTQAVYLRLDALGSNAYTVQLPDGAERALTFDRRYASDLFLPSAQHLLLSDAATRSLVSVDVATGRSRKYTPPSGERLFGAASNSWVFARDGSDALIQRDSLLNSPRPIPAPPGLRLLTDGAISRNGQRLLRLGIAQDQRYAFAVYDMNAGTWSAVTPLDTISRRVANIATDGSVYLTRFNGRTEIWRARSGSALALVAALPVQCYERSVTVSDDGTRVLCNVTSILPDAWMLDLRATLP